MERDVRDLISGAVLALGGAAFALYAYAHYAIGTVRNMGPGLFPLALGILLAVLGALIVLGALVRKGEFPKVDLWTPLLVLLSVGAFALTVDRFGLLPAIVVTTVVASLAELRIRIVSTLALCIGLSVFAWLVFGQGLGLSIPLWRLPGWI